MARTTEQAVKDILLKDYDTMLNPSLLPFIDSASVIVSRVIECAARKGITVTSEEAELMERWVAAYLYTQSDATYLERQTLRASGKFNKADDAYLKGALGIDPSGGCLKGIMAGGGKVRLIWMGKPKSAQIDYEDRN